MENEANDPDAASDPTPRSRGLSSAVSAWCARGALIPFGEHRVFVVDEGGASPSDTAIVLVHGFPESSFALAGTFDRLAKEHRVIAFDLLGFGLSDKPEGHSYSLFEQADLVEVVLRARGVRRVHLLAHDMGTSVATELCARRERGLLSFSLASLTLTNGSVFLEMARLTPSQKLLRLPFAGGFFARISSFFTFKTQVRRLFGRPVKDQALRDMFALIERDDGKARLAAIVGYLKERTRFASRWTGPLTRLDIPAHVIWGQRDPVAIPAIGERLAREIPSARITRLDDVGHFTPMEAPDELAEAVLSLIREGA